MTINITAIKCPTSSEIPILQKISSEENKNNFSAFLKELSEELVKTGEGFNAPQKLLDLLQRGQDDTQINQPQAMQFITELFSMFFSNAMNAADFSMQSSFSDSGKSLAGIKQDRSLQNLFTAAQELSEPQKPQQPMAEMLWKASEETINPDIAEFKEILSKTEPSLSETSLFMLQKDFANSIKTLQEVVEKNKNQEEKNGEIPNADVLQASADKHRAGFTGTLQTAVLNVPEKSPEPIEALPTLTQIRLGICKGISDGSKEFIIRLKPEGLGEITVKLLDKSGKMTIDLIASSSQAAKIINNDLSALREAMRPFQVEVHEAVQNAPQTSSGGVFSGMAQSGFSGEQAGHHFPGFTSMQYHPDFSDRTEEFAEEFLQAAMASSQNIELDTYI